MRTDNERLCNQMLRFPVVPALGQSGPTGCVTMRRPSGVHIVAVQQEGRRFRVDIRHMQGHPPGREENVSRSRLKVPWEDVVPFDSSMDGWRRLKAESIDDHEASALWAALELVVPSEVAELSVASSDDSLTVHDHVAFETLPDRPWMPSNPVRGAGGGRLPPSSALLRRRLTKGLLSAFNPRE